MCCLPSHFIVTVPIRDNQPTVWRGVDRNQNRISHSAQHADDLDDRRTWMLLDGNTDIEMRYYHAVDRIRW